MPAPLTSSFTLPLIPKYLQHGALALLAQLRKLTFWLDGKKSYCREESDPRYVNNSSEVRLRSFTTKVHKVDTMVSYKAEATEEEQE